MDPVKAVFVCERCGKACSTEWNLGQHQKRKIPCLPAEPPADEPPGDAQPGDAQPPAGPALKHAGPALRSAGPALKHAGPALKQASPAPKQASPAPKQASPAPKQAGPTLKQAGPAPKQAGPAPKQAGPAPKKPAEPGRSAGNEADPVGRTGLAADWQVSSWPIGPSADWPPFGGGARGLASGLAGGPTLGAATEARVTHATEAARAAIAKVTEAGLMPQGWNPLGVATAGTSRIINVNVDWPESWYEMDGPPPPETLARIIQTLRQCGEDVAHSNNFEPEAIAALFRDALEKFVF